MSQCVVWLCCNKKKSNSASGGLLNCRKRERERWEDKEREKTEIDGLENRVAVFYYMRGTSTPTTR